MGGNRRLDAVGVTHFAIASPNLCSLEDLTLSSTQNFENPEDFQSSSLATALRTLTALTSLHLDCPDKTRKNGMALFRQLRDTRLLVAKVM